MRASRLVLCGCLLGVATLACVPDTQARRPKRRTESIRKAPAWIREVVKREGDDAGTGVVWLHRELLVQPLERGGFVERSRFALRVTRESGLDDVTSFGAYYEEGDRTPKITAWIADPAGEVTRPDRDADFNDVPAIRDYSIYEDTRYRYVVPPAVKVGSVVAVEISARRGRDYGLAFHELAPRSAPTLLTRFELEIPEGWTYEAQTKRLDGFSVTRDATRFVAEGRDVPPTEALWTAASCHGSRPEVRVRWWSSDGSRGFETWDDVGRAMHALIEPVLGDASRASARGAVLAPRPDESPLDAIARAYEVAAREVRYVSVQVGVGGYRPYPPDDVLETSFGDCKGKTFLMRALAGSWGVETFPVFVRTRDAGPLEEGLPGPTQFNHMIAALKLPEGLEDPPWASLEVEGIGRLLFVDPTASSRGVLDLPSQDQGTTALLVLPDGGRLVELPVQPADVAQVERVFEGAVRPSGAWQDARVVETWSGSAAHALRAHLAALSRSGREEWLAERVARDLDGAEPLGLAIEGLHAIDAPLKLRYEVAGRRAVKKIRDMVIVEPGALAKGVVRGDLPRRLPEGCAYAPGTPRRESVRVALRVPPGLKPESIPRPASGESEELSYEASWRFEEGVLHYERAAALSAIRVSGERYRAFRKLARSLSKADRRSIVLVEGGSP